MAAKYLNRLITSFPSLTCDPPLVFAILETLTLLRRSRENEFLDEVLGLNDLGSLDVLIGFTGQPDIRVPFGACGHYSQAVRQLPGSEPDALPAATRLEYMVRACFESGAHGTTLNVAGEAISQE